jgi:hypothetical protein
MNKNPKLENLKPFPKGKSGNPKGKEKGTLNRATILRKYADAIERTKNPITGVLEDLTQEELCNIALLIEGKKGNVQAIKEIMDTLYGKQTQPTDITTDGDKLGVSTEELRLLWKESLKHGHE